MGNINAQPGYIIKHKRSLAAITAARDLSY